MAYRFVVKSTLALCFLLSCSGAVIVLPRVAEAKPPAAKAAKQPIGVGAISGPQSAKVRAKLLKILRDSGSYEVTDVEDIKPGAPAAQYQTMARGIQADAIVVGRVSRAMVLTLSVYGANGARVDAVQVKGNGSAPKLLREMDDELEISLADPFARSRGEAKAESAAPAAAASGPAAAPAADSDADGDDTASAKPQASPAPKPAAKGKGNELDAVDIPASPTEAPAPEGDASTGDASTSSASSDSDEHGLRPLELSAGVRGYNRKFAYTGITQGPLVPYELALAPTIFVAGRVYPAAFSGNGVLSHIGIMGRFEYGIATSTNYESPPDANGKSAVTPLKTQTYEYQVGVRGRLPLAHHELGIFALYGDQSFTLTGDENPNKQPYALVPDVHYHYLRIGVDARFYISKLVVAAHFAPRFLTSMKELDKSRVWFPDAIGSGVDMGVMLGWRVLSWLTPTAGFDYVRYGFNFNNQPPIPAPRVIAGGATDTYFSGWVGALMNFDFNGSSAQASASTSTENSSAPESTSDSAKPEKVELDEEPAATSAKTKKGETSATKAGSVPEPAPKANKKTSTAGHASGRKKSAAPVEEEDEED